MTFFLDRYCERAGEAGLFAEPLNALTNVAFIIAAILIWRRLVADPALSPRRQWDIAVLALIVFAIGLGSAAWHLYPVTVTHLSDVIPITLFILGFILAFMVRVANLAWYWAIAVVGFFIAVSYGAPPLLSIRPLGGSAAYFPAIAALALTCAGLYALGNPRLKLMLVAFGLFTVSLTLRSVDGVACDALPIGTHFVWHMLNAAVLYTLLCVLLEAAREEPVGLPELDSNEAAQ